MTVFKPTTWWKFDRYTISEGAIRPAPGARWHAYDPWEIFESAKGKYRKANTLWGEFLEYSRRIQAESGTARKPSLAGEALILEWCTHYGLLGILPGQAQFISLPPTYENVDQYTGVAVARSQRCIVQRRFARVAGRWIGHYVVRGEATPLIADSDWSAGKAVPRSGWGTRLETPRMIFWDWESFEWKNDEGNQRLSSFFSCQAENGQYPRPLSDDFWDVYQEPLWAWTRAALVFSEAAELVSQYAAARFSGKPWSDETLPRVNDALWILNSLSASETYSYEFGPSALQRNLTSPSLLSTMAEMFFLDIMARRRALRCQACGKIFVSNDVKSAYCSTTCRHTARTRRYRVRLLEKG